MTFLNVALLGGMALAAVPIVLHLAMRRQPRHLEFPAVRFIQRRRDANRRRLRLRHLLLLCVRCALIGLLALALARPSIQATGALGDEEAPVAAALVFDTAPHMLYRHHDGARLHAAQQTASWLISQLPRESDVAVLDSRALAAAFSVDLSAARQRIERLEATNRPLAITASVADALSLLAENDKARKELYVFSDLSRASWSTSALQSLQKALERAPDAAVYLIDVGVAEPRNWSLGAPKLSNELVPHGATLRVQVDVASLGVQGERTVELWMLDPSGTPIRRGQQLCTLSPGEAQTLQFALGTFGEGAHQGYLKIAGEDGLACDDIRYFTLETRAAWRVLIAAPSSRHTEPLFLAEALAPSSLRLTGNAAFRPEIAPIARLGQIRLGDYAIAALADPGPLDDATWRQLSEYAASGGRIAILLGRNAFPVDRFHGVAALEVLPGKLLRQFRAPLDGVFLSPDNLQHPALARFRPIESSTPWSESPVFRHWEFAGLANDASVVVSFSNDLPAIVERPLGAGRVIAFSTPFTDRFSVDSQAPGDPEAGRTADRDGPWNLLPADWPGVMLVEQVFAYLAGASEFRLNYQAGETAVLHVDRDPAPGMLIVSNPHGENVRQNVHPRRRTVEISATDELGNYRARGGGEAAGVDLGFSVNLPPEASVLDRVTTDEIIQGLAPAKVRIAANRDEIDRNVNLGRVGRELFPILMLLVAALVAIESIISNRFYPEVRSQGDSQRAKQWARLWRSGDRPSSESSESPREVVAP